MIDLTLCNDTRHNTYSKTWHIFFFSNHTTHSSTASHPTLCQVVLFFSLCFSFPFIFVFSSFEIKLCYHPFYSLKAFDITIKISISFLCFSPTITHLTNVLWMIDYSRILYVLWFWCLLRWCAVFGFMNKFNLCLKL